MTFYRPFCGFIIFNRLDSWMRQPTAGGDSISSRQFTTTINTKTGRMLYNSISVQINFVRHKGELAFPAGFTPPGFLNQHSPLIMFRNAEVFSFHSNCPAKARVASNQLVWEFKLFCSSHYPCKYLLLISKRVWCDHHAHAGSCPSSSISLTCLV